MPKPAKVAKEKQPASDLREANVFGSTPNRAKLKVQTRGDSGKTSRMDLSKAEKGTGPGKP